MFAFENNRWFRLGTNGLLVLLCSFGVSASAHSSAKAPQFKSLSEFSSCMNEGNSNEICLNALEKYVRATPNDAMKAAKLVRLNFNSPVSLRFFEMAAKKANQGFCQDSDLQLAVVAGLDLPKDYPDAERARTLFSGKCHGDLTAPVVKEIDSQNYMSYLKENACPILQQHKQAPPSCQPAPVAKAEPEVEERLPKLDKSQIKLGVIKVYRGPEGESVTMAPIQGGDLFLIRFDGINSPWNGKVLLHKRVDKGNDAANFWTEYNGKRWNSVLRRHGMEVYVPGSSAANGFSVGYADKLSKEADPVALINDYTP